MNVTVSCPHQTGAVRSCRACKSIDTGEGMVACDGDISASVTLDSEGDAGVIGGIHHFWAVEDIDSSCGCALDDAEQVRVHDQLIEAGSEPYDPADDMSMSNFETFL